MKIAFTICSNNYLAQAKALGDSLKEHNPDYEFFIGLVDKKSDLIDYENEIGHKIILSNEIGIPDFDSLWKKYDIVEFNTCVKPFFFEYFINQNTDIEFLYYLDPDTFVFNSFKIIEEEFGAENNILLTPHIVSPINLDGKQPDEPLFLNHGIYNLGFLGLKKPTLSIGLLNWWKERTYKLGYDRICKGLFVDQLWLNLVPLLFRYVKCSFHLGLNMAPWNLHERRLKVSNNEIIVNDNFKLVFYHFSNYKYSFPELLASNYDRYSLKERIDLQEIYKSYLNELIANNIGKLHIISCKYMEMREKYLVESEKLKIIELKKIKREKMTFSWWVNKIIINLLPPIVFKLSKIRDLKP
jgi:hypothetical protein